MIWYTAYHTETVLTFDDFASLGTFVNGPGRRLILLSPGLVHNSVGVRGPVQQPDERCCPFLETRVGVNRVATAGSSELILEAFGIRDVAQADANRRLGQFMKD